MSRVIKKLFALLPIPQKYVYQTTETHNTSNQDFITGPDEDPFPSQTHHQKPFPLNTSDNNLFESSKLNSMYAGTLLRKGEQDQIFTEPTPSESSALTFKATISRILGLIKRYLLIKIRDVHRLANLSYFPITDVLIGGLMWMWQERQLGVSESTTIVYVCELTFWIIINSTQFETCFNFLEELQSRNVINLFASTLHHGEWLVASFMLSTIESLMAAGFCSILVYFGFSFSLLSLGWYLPCFLILLIMSGWIMALFTISILIYHGQRMTVLLWALPYFILPLSAAYYPLEALPTAMQYVGKALPTTYLFEALRSYIATQNVPISYFIISLLLNILYLICAVTFFNFMFKKSKEKGLARLEND